MTSRFMDNLLKAGLPTSSTAVSQCHGGRMYPARVVRVVAFACGCICEYPLEGEFAKLKDWHVIACKKHTEDRDSLAQRAEMVWARFSSQS